MYQSGFQGFEEVEDEYSPWDEAAKIIQRAWRSYVVSFPPQIYYKIFTYRPIVDIGANSPKDYHQLLRMKYLTEERDPTLQSTDRTGWYQRVENNYWRLYSCKSIIKEEPIDGFVTKKIDFHPSKMQRIQDVRKWRKRKKIEWLKRMYKEGREEALEEQSYQSDLLTMERKTMKDVMSSIEGKGEEEILDWELDELLAWTNSFNFEEYMEEWINQACSHMSEPNKDRPTSSLMVTRVRSSSNEVKDKYSPWDEAAKIIQRAWRRHACKKVFRNVQKMIGQCYQQDPSLLLRTVNPQEAELLDAAAGVYIQFRLGGVSFPPQIYYKIFTYRPIVDIGANSPKDYHQLLRMKYLTEERDPTLQSTDRTGWYQRVENNNWRLFSCKSIIKEEPIDGFVTKKIDFHPSKMQRIQDVRKWKKRKKIEWLKRMYKEGREEALEKQSDQSDLLTMERKTMKDVMSSIEDKGEEEILDWELDEHLARTNSFNFEEYMEEWINQACSHTSEPNKDCPTSKFSPQSTRYKEGREEALEEQSYQSDLLTMERKTMKDVMSSIEGKGEEEILDWELDEHLARTNSFNFEEYMEEWINQACGLTSEQRSYNIIADGDSRSELQ